MVNKKLVTYNKDGTACMNCKITDESFLYYLGTIFNACIEKWGISYKDFSKITVKYNLINYIYDNFLYLCNYGTPTVILEIEEHIKKRGGIK